MKWLLKNFLKILACLVPLNLLLNACSGVLFHNVTEQLGGAMSELEALEQIDISSAKQHYWQVLDADGNELYVIADAAQIKALDELLLSDTDGTGIWDTTEENLLYTYAFWQEETLKAGQSPEAKRDYKELLRFSVCEGSDAAKLDIFPGAAPLLPGLAEDALLDLAVKLSQTEAEALRNPAQFAE